MLSAERIQEIAAYCTQRARYTFKNNALLIQALTRPSAKGIYVRSDAPDFERLEFVGDRVLNLAITERLQDLYPTATPGELHQFYEKYTRNSDPSKRNGGPLYRVAKEMQLEALIIKSDDEDLEQHAFRGKLSSRQKSKEGHLSDHVEAFIGAMYLDSNRNMLIVSEWVEFFWQHMGLNDGEISESSFGTSAISNTAIDIQQNIKQDNIDAQLLEAAVAGNFTKFKKALKEGANILKKDQDGRNGLHHFSMHGDESAVYYILVSFPEVDVNLVDDHHGTALYYAAGRGRPSAVEHLLEYGAHIHIDLPGNTVKSIYMQATRYGHVPVMNLLLKYRWYALLSEEFEESIKIVGFNEESHLRKAIIVKEHNRRMFEAAELIIYHPTEKADSVSDVKNAVKHGANIYARNIEGMSIFTLLKSMRVEPRFDILAFILAATKKIRLSEIDLKGISADATQHHKKIILPVFQQLSDIRDANMEDDSVVAILDDWLQELSESMKPPNASKGKQPLSKSSSLHFSGPSRSASSSSSSSSFSPATSKRN